MGWLLSFKACWVNFVKASTWIISSVPSEGTNTAIKWSYFWKTDWAQCACIKHRLADWLGLFPRLPVGDLEPKGNQLYIFLNNLGRLNVINLLQKIHWGLLGATQNITPNEVELFMARLRIGIINWLGQKVSVMLVITLACVVLEFLFFKIKISKSHPVRALERKKSTKAIEE